MKISSGFLNNILTQNIPEFQGGNISIDSRNLNNGDIFIAIPGKNFDGHCFVQDALDKGAGVAIIENPIFEIPGKTILVENSIETLKLIAKEILNYAELKKILAITGSVGKTTTRSWLNQILNFKYKAFSSIKNYNNIYGLSISLSLLEKGFDYGIFEIGSNGIGEIYELSSYLNPNLALLTNIYDSHIGNFKNLENLAYEKINIIDGIQPGGILIYDGDCKFKPLIKQRMNDKKISGISVGYDKFCDFKIIENNLNNITLKTPLGNIEYSIGTTCGKHLVSVSAFIWATIFALDLPFEDFIPKFKELFALKGRGKILDLSYKGKELKIIDDSYNASPSAVLMAIENFEAMASLEKIFVFGEMKELGEYEQHYHELVAQRIKKSDIKKIFFIGDSKLWKFFEKDNRVECFLEINDFVVEKILKIMENKSIVLLKGSRSIALDKVISHINKSVL